MLRTLGLFVTAALIALSGCRSATEINVTAPEPPQSVPESYSIIGRSLDGRGIECHKLGNGYEHIVFVAGIHGSEPAGVPLSRQLGAVLKANPELLLNKTIIIVNNANPDGLAKGQRYNNNGIDLNRNFPARNHTTKRDRHGERPLSEPESRALFDLFRSLPRKPSRVITLHQPLVCIDYDGPEDITLPLAEALAEAANLPVKKLGSRPGSLGSWLGVDQQIPTITVEFYKSDTQLSDDELWQRYGDMMLTAVTYPRKPGPRQVPRSSKRFRTGN
ncbi:DUF2817 domain-containing protein [Mucisphaera calidilacus]|uniref:Bacteriocin BCN5 n=1 Tax=Mucisphaera calidilacus TaxID=2527982 RepID=A0A518BY01_9BACT|nr:DUF2817 domain-containing protein [Mucisphaera calidilacus]QDU71851.1 Bacteriocin BCN5 [Mucisphaera calidilacus]